MPKAKTYFAQVPVEIAKKAAEAEASGDAVPVPERSAKKSSKNGVPAEAKPDESEGV